MEVLSDPSRARTSKKAPQKSRMSDKQPGGPAASKKKHRHRKRRRGLPAPVVFGLLVPLGLVSAGAVFVLGKTMVVPAATVCLLIVWALYVNDRKGFVRSKQMRRAHEPRRHFAPLEVILLFVLILLNVVAVAYVFVTL